MEELDIKQQLHLLQKQVEASASLTEETQLALLAAIDNAKIEIEVLRRLMKRYHPEFARYYAIFREEVVRGVDPEWTKQETSEKNDF